MVTIRKAQFEDFDNIMLLHKRYDLYTRSREEWEHIWKNNPVFISRKETWTIGWVLEDKDNIVGYFGNIPLLYSYKGKELITAAASCFVVDIKCRNFSLLLLNAFFRQDNVDLILNTTANCEAEKIFSGYRAQKIPSPNLQDAFFWVTSYPRFIDSVFRKKKLPCRTFLKYPLSCAMWITDKFTKRNQITKSYLSVNLLGNFDERFDVFSHKLVIKYPELILSPRNKEYLDWHFKYAIDKKQLWIFTLEKEGEILSYALFLRKDIEDIGLRKVNLVDYRSLDNDDNILKDMIMLGLQKSREENIHMMEVVGFNTGKREIIKKMNPYTRRLLSWPFFYKLADKKLDTDFIDSAVWDACCFDGDASL